MITLFEDRRIECAAIRSDHDGKIYAIARPARHNDIISHLAFDLGFPKPIVGQQGFLTNKGTFVGRHEANLIAYMSGQTSKLGPHGLFSEDVW